MKRFVAIGIVVAAALLIVTGATYAAVNNFSATVQLSGGPVNGDAQLCDAAGNCGKTLSNLLTDANGRVQVTGKGGCVPGVYPFIVTAPGLPTASGTFTINPGPMAAIVIASGDKQAVAVKATSVPIVISGADQCGNPL